MWFHWFVANVYMQNRIFIFFLVALCCCGMSQAQTNVSGNLSSNFTWTKAGSPYILTGDLNIGNGVTLTIDPGVIVRSSGNYQIRLSNSRSGIQAIGTETDSIKFEVPNQQQHFITFSNTDLSRSRFSFIAVEGTGTTNYENQFLVSEKATSGNSSALSISNSYLYNTAVRIGDDGGRVELKDSKLVRTYFWSHYSGSGYDVEGSEFYYSNFAYDWRNGFSGETLGETVFQNSKLINSPLYLARSLVTINESGIFANDRNLRASPSSGTGTLVYAHSLTMTHTFMNCGGNTAINVNSWFDSSETTITGNVIREVYDALSASGDFANLVFSGNDIISPKALSYIRNLSGQNIDATNNFFDGQMDSNALEELIFHKPDNDSNGLVDFSQARSERQVSDVLISPEVKITRLYQSGVHLDQIKLDWSNGLLSDYDKILVYKSLSQNTYSLSLLGENDPGESPVYDYEEGSVYFIKGKTSSGEESIISTPLNTIPAFYVDFDGENQEPRNEYLIPFKVYSSEDELLKINIESIDDGNYVKVISAELEQTEKKNDTTYYQLKLVPQANIFGRVYLKFVYDDGINNGDYGYSFKIKKVPEVTKLSVIDHKEGFLYNLNHVDFSEYVEWVAEEGANVRVKITEVLAGELFLGEEVVTSVDKLPEYASSSPKLNWKAPSQTGVVEAFKIKLFDNNYESDSESVVQFNLAANHAPLVTKYDTLGPGNEDMLQGLFFSSFHNHNQVEDAEGDNIFYEITEVVNGTLFEDYYREEETTLPRIFDDNSERRSLFWVPPANVNGRIEALRIRATDGSKYDDEHSVYFDIPAVNDPPTFDHIYCPPTAPFPGEIQEIQITGISAGPFEEGQPLSFFVTSSNEELLPSNWIEVLYEDGAESATLRYLPPKEFSGTVTIDVNLSDGELIATQNVPLNFLPENSPPNLNLTGTLKAYVSYPFSLGYEITDDRPNVLSSASTNSSWLAIDNKPRITTITKRRLDYNQDEENGLLSQAVIVDLSTSVTDKHGNVWYSRGREIKMITANGEVKSVAGAPSSGFVDGLGREARFGLARSLAYDQNQDIVLIVDSSNKAIRRIDQDFNVTTIWSSTDNDEFRSIEVADVDSNGNLYLTVTSYYRGNKRYLYKLDTNGEMSYFAGAGETNDQPLEGSKEEVAIYSQGRLQVVNDDIYIINAGLLRKIDTDGQVSIITLDEVLETAPAYGGDGFILKDGPNHLLVFRKNIGKMARLDVRDLSYEMILGKGQEVFTDGMVAEELILERNNTNFTGAAIYPGKGIILSLVEQNEFFLTLIHNEVGSVTGTAETGDIGLHEVNFTLTDINGLTTEQVVTIDVLANNQIQATNLNQTYEFDEGVAEIDPANVILSGMTTQEQARVTIELSSFASGRLSANSGNGETFDETTGTWQIVGSQASVNAALTAIVFQPNQDFESSSEARVTVVNDKGGVPNTGTWHFNVTAVNDEPRITSNLDTTAYIDIPFSLSFEMEDPDNELFNFEIGQTPDWLQYLSGEFWAEVYAGDPTGDEWAHTIDGPLRYARFRRPTQLELDRKNNIYVVEDGYLRKISSQGEVSSYVRFSYGYNDGTLEQAVIGNISALAFDENNDMYIADSGNRRLRKITESGQVSTIAGSGDYGDQDGAAMSASFGYVRALTIHPNGDIYVADSYRVRKLDTSGQVSTVAGTGQLGYALGDALSIPFYEIIDLKFDEAGNLIIADEKSIRKLELVTGLVSSVLSEGKTSGISAIDLSDKGELYVTNRNHVIQVFEESDSYDFLTSLYYTNSSLPVPAGDFRFEEAAGLVILGNNLFISEKWDNNIVRIYLKPGRLAGSPGVSDLGENQFGYTLINNEQQRVEGTGRIYVEENDLVKFKGLDSTYVYTEDIALTFEKLRITDNSTDDLDLSIQLNDPELGMLSASGFEQFYSEGTWTLTGKQDYLNEFLASLTYTPQPGSYARNLIRVNARRHGGMFETRGEIRLQGLSVNDVPQFLALSDTSLRVGAQVEIPVLTQDEDGNPVQLSSEDLPDWLSIERRLVSYVKTIAGGGNRSGDGPKREARLSYPLGFAEAPDGSLYFTDSNTIKYLTEDSVKVFSQIAYPYSERPQKLLFRGDSLLFASKWGIYWAKSPTEYLLLAGSTESGDADGKGDEARFNLIVDITLTPDRKSILVADSNNGKVRQVDLSDFSVKTILGPEVPNLPDSPDEVRTIYPANLSGTPDGKHFLLDRNASRIFQFDQEGNLTYPDYPEDSGWADITSLSPIFVLETDVFGNHFLVTPARVYWTDALGNFTHLAGTTSQGEQDGPGKEASFRYISDLLILPDGRIMVTDASSDLIREVSYAYEYFLVGEVPEGVEGIYDITLDLTDGYVEESVPESWRLEVLASDRPDVSGIGQEITYTEDSPQVEIAPIEIENFIEGQVYEASFFVDQLYTGTIETTSTAVVSEHSPGRLTISGVGEYINDALAKLVFVPALNNIHETNVAVKIRQQDGVLNVMGTIHLTPQALNDAPVLRADREDTVAFVGEKMIIGLHASDTESKVFPQAVDINTWPDWLLITKAGIKAETYAGLPGEAGMTDGDRLDSKFSSPTFMDVDFEGNAYVVDGLTQVIRLISTDGRVSHFSGSGIRGYVDGSKDEAQFDAILGLVIDKYNNLYVNDIGNGVIRKIDHLGNVSTVAGGGDPELKIGKATEVSVNVSAMVYDQEESTIYLLDGEDGVIRRFNPETGQISNLPYEDNYANELMTTGRDLQIGPDGLIYVLIDNGILKLNKSGFNVGTTNSLHSPVQDGHVNESSINSTAFVIDPSGEIILNHGGEIRLKYMRYNQINSFPIRPVLTHGVGFDESIGIGAIRDFAKLPDGSYLATDQVNNVIWKMWFHPWVVTGTPQVDDVGSNEVSLFTEDPEGEQTSLTLNIDVRDEAVMNIANLNTAVVYQEGQTTVDFPKLNINDGFQGEISVVIHVESGSGELGASASELLPYDEEDESWSLTDNVDGLNSWFDKLKYFPGSDNKRDMLLSLVFLKEGQIKKTEGKIDFIYQELNSAPIYTGPAVLEVSANEVTDLSFKAVDQDGDSVVFSLNALPKWLERQEEWYVQDHYSARFSENLNDSLSALFSLFPSDILQTEEGDLLVVNRIQNRIERLTETLERSVFAGSGEWGRANGSALEAQFANPNHIIYNQDSSGFLITDSGNGLIREIDENGVVSNFSGNGGTSSSDGIGQHIGYQRPESIIYAGDGSYYIIDQLAHSIRMRHANTSVTTLVAKAEDTHSKDGPLGEASTFNPQRLEINKYGQLFFLETRELRMIYDNEIFTLTGKEDGVSYLDGTLEEAQFGTPTDLALYSDSVFLVTDRVYHTIRMIDLVNQQVTTIAGTGERGDRVGPASQAVFDNPQRIDRLKDGSFLVWDYGVNGFKLLSRNVHALSARPEEEHVGDHQVMLTISDGKGGVTTTPITIRVLTPNSAPLSTEIDDLETTYSESGELTVSLFEIFEDDESADTELTYQVITNSDETTVTTETVDSGDGILKINVHGAGSSNLEVRATDPRGASVTVSFGVTVKKAGAQVSFGTLEFLNDGDTQIPTVTTDPEGLKVVLTYEGNDTAPSAIGDYEVVATIDERNYQGSAAATMSIINVAPEDIALDNNAIFENRAIGEIIGVLSTTDRNPTDTHTYSLPSGTTDNDRFGLDGDKLLSGESFDFETKDSYTITVEVSDGQGGSYQEEFIIAVQDVNDAPVINDHQDIELIADLGEMSIELTGLASGGEAGQSFTATTSVDGVVGAASASVDAENATVTITFQTTGQSGNGSISLTIKDDGGTTNGGVDSYTTNIDVSVLEANITTTAGENCGPGEVTMTASGADDYRWYEQPLNGSSVNSGDEFVINLTENKIYFVAGVFAGEESKLRVPVEARILEIPETPVISNDNGLLSVSPVDGLTYSWFFNEELIDGATGISFTPNETGNYKVRATNSNGCFAESTAVLVVVAGLEDEVTLVDAVLYPNPASGLVTVDFDQVLSKGTILRMTDNNGRELLNMTFKEASKQVVVDVSALPEGVHLVTARDGDKLVRKRIIIQR